MIIMFLYEDKEFIGKKIKQFRIKAKLSQAELSEKIGMTEKNLSNIERGLQIPAPQIHRSLAALCPRTAAIN